MIYLPHQLVHDFFHQQYWTETHFFGYASKNSWTTWLFKILKNPTNAIKDSSFWRERVLDRFICVNGSWFRTRKDHEISFLDWNTFSITKVKLVASFPYQSMIFAHRKTLERYPQTSPNLRLKKPSFRNCWWKVRGIFQGYVGEIFEPKNLLRHLLLQLWDGNDEITSLSLQKLRISFIHSFIQPISGVQKKGTHVCHTPVGSPGQHI